MSGGINQVVLVGRLTRDPEIRIATTGMKICTFNLAVDRIKSSKDDNNAHQTADYPRCKAFGKKAEILELYCHQGDQLGIVGQIQTGSYENNEGQKIYTTDVVVDRLSMLGSKKSNETKSETSEANESRPQAMTESEEDTYPAAGSQATAKQNSQMTADSLNWGSNPLNISSDDLPF